MHPVPEKLPMKLLSTTLAMTTASFTALTLFVGYLAPSALDIATRAHAASTARLGDLSRFRSLVGEVATAVNKGDMVAAKQHTTNLESAWDAAEAGIKPRSAADWHLVDKALDTLYKAIRADRPDPGTSKQALASVIASMDTAQGRVR
jgi:hypothetical protein